ncbi:MAG: hypothetical protein HXS48_15195 [Theionarchaea archaeon]|nr:hypothetical protein [Theionarchaea archaeon]
MNGEKKPKILVIAKGNYPEEVDSANYEEMTLECHPNIAEYDIVVLDLVNVDPSSARILTQAPAFDRKCIHNLLWAGHKLILITDGENFVPLGERNRTNIFHHLPIQVHLTKETGNIVLLKKEFYEDYFRIHVGGQWNYYLDLEKDLSLHFDNIKALFSENHTNVCFKEKEIIATNGFGKPVSFSVKYGLNVGGVSGSIIFLQPPNESKSIESAIKTLLCNYGVHISTPAPAWTVDIEVPGEKEVQKKIEKLEKKKQMLEENIRNGEKERDEITCFKKLLYESGDELKDIVWKTLEEIGFNVNEYDKKKEDGSIEENGEITLLEIKGTIKSAATDHLRQLDDYVLDYLATEGKKPRGLLIINHYRLLEPDKRDEPFPEDTRRYIEIRSSELSAMTTMKLFDMYCRIKKGELSSKEARVEITESRGIIT